jgi:hypothetical protein
MRAPVQGLSILDGSVALATLRQALSFQKGAGEEAA